MALKISRPDNIQLYETRNGSMVLLTEKRPLTSKDNSFSYSGYLVNMNEEGNIYLEEVKWENNNKFRLDGTEHKLDIKESYTPSFVPDSTINDIKTACFVMFLGSGYHEEEINRLTYTYFDSSKGIILSRKEPVIKKEPKKEKPVITYESKEEKEEEDIKLDIPLLPFFLFSIVTVLLFPTLLHFTYLYQKVKYLADPDSTLYAIGYYIISTLSVFITSAYELIGGVSIVVCALYFFNKYIEEKNKTKGTKND